MIVELVLSEYGGRTGDELSALTYTEAPWLESRKGMREGAQGRRPITKQSMVRFFPDKRTLGSRTAADLAAGGLYLHAPEAACDVTELLDNFYMARPEELVDEEMGLIDEVDHTGTTPREPIAKRHRGQEIAPQALVCRCRRAAGNSRAATDQREDIARRDRSVFLIASGVLAQATPPA